MKFYPIYLINFCFFFLEMVACKHHLNETCIEEEMMRAERDAGRAFDRIAGVDKVYEARIESADDEGSVKLAYSKYRTDPQTGKTIVKFRKGTVVGEDDEVIQEGTEIDLSDGVLFYDWREGLSAAISEDDDFESFLTVNTSDAATSCRLKLSHHAKHGRVITHQDLGYFRLSPDGTKIVYSAEVKGHPTVFIYDIAELSFKRVGLVPADYAPGHVQWHPDSRSLVGIAWKTTPLAPQSYSANNQVDRLFVYFLEDDSFHFLTGLGHHHSSPRLSPSGDWMVFLENSLRSSTSPTFIPGPYAISERLVRVAWKNVLQHVKNGTFFEQSDSSRRIIVGNSQSRAEYPVRTLDGTDFYGLYPTLPLPERIFSFDENSIFLSVYLSADVRLLEIQLNDGNTSLAFHPNPGLFLLDIHKDVMLVRKDFINQSVHLAMGRLIHGQATTTTTSTTTESSTTLDACEQLESEVTVNVNNDTVTNPTITDHNPTQQSLLLQANFINLTAYQTHNYYSEVFHFDTPEFKADDDDCMTFFNAWYNEPSSFMMMKKEPLPLLVFLLDGPHAVQPRVHHWIYDFALNRAMAVLVINPRGAKGMGDRVLQAIVGNVGKMDVSDAHQAIQHVLDKKKNLDKDKVTLVGYSYGGLIASRLTADYPDAYDSLLLLNPMLDLLACRHLGGFVEGILGRNYTAGSVEDIKTINMAWDSSSLPKANHIEASTAIFVGEDDKVTLPELNGKRLHDSLLERGFKSKFEVLENVGHQIADNESKKKLISMSYSWLHWQWGSFSANCTSSHPPTTTTKPSTTTAKSASGMAIHKVLAFLLPTAMAGIAAL